MKPLLFLLLAVSVQAAPERQARIPFYLQPPAKQAPVIDAEARRQIAAYLRQVAEQQKLSADILDNEKADFYFLGREKAFLDAAHIVETYQPEVKK